MLQPDANAWRTDVVWGASTTNDGESVIWGTVCASAGCDTIGWSRTWLGAPARPAAPCGRLLRGLGVRQHRLGHRGGRRQHRVGRRVRRQGLSGTRVGHELRRPRASAPTTSSGARAPRTKKTTSSGAPAANRSRRRAATWCGACRPAVNPSPRGAGATPGSTNADPKHETGADPGVRAALRGAKPCGAADDEDPAAPGPAVRLRGHRGGRGPAGRILPDQDVRVARAVPRAARCCRR